MESNRKLFPSLINSFWKNKPKDDHFIYDLKKMPALKNLLKYDEKFNNKRKVEFESVLSGIIIKNPRSIKSVVNHVAKSIWPEIHDAFLKSKLSKFWICKHMFDVFYANEDIKTIFLDDTKNINFSIEIFYQWMQKIIFSKKDEDVYKQLMLIREYGYFFIRPYEHMPSFKALNNGRGINIIPNGAGDTNNKIKMHMLWKKYRGDNWPPSESLERSRINIQKMNKSKKTCSFGIYSSEEKMNEAIKKFIPTVHLHLPGMNVWRVTNTSSFTKNARYVLDMPLIASQSDSISLLLIPAMVAGKLSHQALRVYNLAVMSYMVGNGHHSIHEFKAVFDKFNIPYVDGDYASLFPNGFIQKHPELLELQEMFPDIFSVKWRASL